MKNSGTAIVLFVSVLTAFGCDQPAPRPDTQADVSAINAVREREIALVGSGDVDKLLTVYTSDIVMMPPNEPAVVGQEAVRRWADAMFGQITMSGSYSSADVSVSGDWAFDRYTGVLRVTPKAGGATIEERIKGIHIMKRQPDGTWLIAQDIWNTDAPPPGPAPPATP
ncbi:MAG: YybH family protein [Acidobacteriota bacterium]